MVKYRVHACTDVTGFGLMGHGLEMAQGSNTRLEIDTNALNLIPASLEFAQMGILPAGMYRNRNFAEEFVDAGAVSLAVQDMLYDPQTSGGLLIALPEAEAEDCLRQLRESIPEAAIVGHVTQRQDSWITVE